jgi:PAS domain S-box-containing protein
VEIRRPDRVVPIEAWGTPVRGQDGAVEYAIGVFADISERRATEALQRQAALLDLSRDAIYLRDAHRRITYWNRGAEVSYGWSAAEALGQVSYDLLHTEFGHPIEEIEATLSSAGHWDGELVQHTRSGERRIVASRWVLLRDRAGGIESVMAINTDITEAKAAENALAEQNHTLTTMAGRLAASNRDLEQFAYAASHDLSEPLRAISGPISLLGRRYRGRLDADADQFIDFAVDGCERMQNLIDDMLAYSRVDRIETQPTSVDTGAVLQSTIAALRALISERQVEITAGALPTVTAAPAQIGSLLQNLIANAIKFTPPERIPRIHLDCRDDPTEWRFSVTDNGIGIDAAHRERIFGMFKRLHTRETYPGTGIGLALCMKIVERHGGAIGVEDGPHGTGSTFWFTLPHPPEQPT